MRLSSTSVIDFPYIQTLVKSFFIVFIETTDCIYIVFIHVNNFYKVRDTSVPPILCIWLQRNNDSDIDIELYIIRQQMNFGVYSPVISVLLQTSVHLVQKSF